MFCASIKKILTKKKKKYKKEEEIRMKCREDHLAGLENS